MGRGKGILYNCIMMLWYLLDGLALDDWYMWSIDGFCSIDIIYGDWVVSYLVFPSRLLSPW